jgi:hypothetical protein
VNFLYQVSADFEITVDSKYVFLIDGKTLKKIRISDKVVLQHYAKLAKKLEKSGGADFKYGKIQLTADGKYIFIRPLKGSQGLIQFDILKDTYCNDWYERLRGLAGDP